MHRTILIDADITAFAIASAVEEKITFGDTVVYHTDLEKAFKQVDMTIRRITKATSSHKAVLFLTEGDNYRKQVLPSYKGNRLDMRKPEGLHPIRDHMKANHTCVIEPGIEADDLLGIHATMPHEGERVIFSADKDLKTVPGLHWCPEDGEAITVTEEETRRFFFEQCITGDPTDNYKGCPGAGVKAAADLLDWNLKWFKTDRKLKSGKNKGQMKVTWDKCSLVPTENWWTSVVSAYEKVGLTEDDALIQARCARILRHGEYDFNTKEVKLWTPSLP